MPKKLWITEKTWSVLDHLLDLREAKRKSAALRWWSDDEREKWEWYKEYEPPLVKTVRRLTRRDYQAWLEDEQVKVEEAAAQGRLKPLWGVGPKAQGWQGQKRYSEIWDFFG